MMKNRLCFATNNANKIEEITKFLGDKYDVMGLKQLGVEVDIPETGDSFKENAFIKANYLNKLFGQLSLAEDSGLVVPSLDGAPGIYSSRYSQNTTFSNNQLLLQNLQNIKDRSAYYISIIVLIYGNEIQYFEGKCFGTIGIKEKGSNGFGYDPIFIPNDYDKSFGELDQGIKLKISHRTIAVRQLISFMNHNTINKKGTKTN